MPSAIVITPTTDTEMVSQIMDFNDLPSLSVDSEKMEVSVPEPGFLILESPANPSRNADAWLISVSIARRSNNAHQEAVVLAAEEMCMSLRQRGEHVVPYAPQREMPIA